MSAIKIWSKTGILAIAKFIQLFLEILVNSIRLIVGMEFRTEKL